jgi:hypothetical protein
MRHHFKGIYLLTLKDLRKEWAGKTGLWQAHSIPTRDELGNTSELGYYEGPFEAVLKVVIQDHGRQFLSTSGECGEIIQITPKRVL